MCITWFPVMFQRQKGSKENFFLPTLLLNRWRRWNEKENCSDQYSKSFDARVERRKNVNETRLFSQGHAFTSIQSNSLPDSMTRSRDEEKNHFICSPLLSAYAFKVWSQKGDRKEDAKNRRNVWHVSGMREGREWNLNESLGSEYWRTTKNISLPSN